MRDAQASVHLVAATVGFVSFGVLWISVLWGIVLRNGWALTRLRHGTLYGTHMTLVLIGLTLGVVHALAQLAAPGGTVRLIDQVVPFTNPVDPIGIGFGVIALEVMIAIALSVLVQRWLGYHRWRRMHTLAYTAYVLLTAHLLISGSETQSLQARAIILLMLLVVALAASATKIAQLSRERSRAPSDGPVPDAVMSVDPSRCLRYGFCVQEAPALFRLQSDGRLHYRAAVAPEQIDDAVRAAEACPARAIMLRHRAGGGTTTGATNGHTGHAPPAVSPVAGTYVRGER